MKKRKSYEIVESILNALEDGPKPFTRVLFLSYLTVEPFRRYIEKLEKRGLVRQTDGLLEITEEGRRVKEIIAKTASEIRHFEALEEECRKKRRRRKRNSCFFLKVTRMCTELCLVTCPCPRCMFFSARGEDVCYECDHEVEPYRYRLEPLSETVKRALRSLFFRMLFFFHQRLRA